MRFNQSGQNTAWYPLKSSNLRFIHGKVSVHPVGPPKYRNYPGFRGFYSTATFQKLHVNFYPDNSLQMKEAQVTRIGNRRWSKSKNTGISSSKTQSCPSQIETVIKSNDFIRRIIQLCTALTMPVSCDGVRIDLRVLCSLFLVQKKAGML